VALDSETQQRVMLDMVARTTCNILKSMMEIDGILNPLARLPHEQQALSIVASVRFSGDIRGLFSCEVEQSLAQALVASMMRMEAGSVIDPSLVGSAIGELVNIIAGNALIDERCQKLKVSLEPPKLSIAGETGVRCIHHQVFQVIELVPVVGSMQLALTDMQFSGDIFNGPS